MISTDSWAEFTQSAESPLAPAAQWKQTTGGKVIGHLLPDVPPEIIYAAGALPVALKGAGIPITRAQQHIPGYSCSHAMGLLELGLLDRLGDLDGVVIPYTCDTTRNLFHIWSQRFPNLKNEFLRLPKSVDYDPARAYAAAEFKRLFLSLCAFTDAEPDEAHLNSVIDIYEGARAKLRGLYHQAFDHPAEQRAKYLYAAIQAFSVMPIESFTQTLDQTAWGDAPAADNWIPIYIKGKIMDPPALPELFGELKLKIARDDLVDGYRMIETPAVDGPDPFLRLADRFRNTTPYAGYHIEPRAAAERFLARVKESSAAGVVFLNPQFCEAAGFDTPDFKKTLDGAGIPSLVLETSSRGVSMSRLRLRLEAFREMLEDN